MSNPTPSPAPLLALCLVLSTLAAPAWGQSAAPSAAASEPEAPNQAEVVKMSAFEVTTTQGVGYALTNSADAFKTSQSLMDIPQTDIVLTQDFIHDLGFNNSTDFLMFVGVQGVYEGETAAIRGNRVNGPWLDDAPDGRVYEDSVFIDSMEVIKGPSSVLYPNASLNGQVIKHSKKPLPYEQGIISETINRWGLSRTVIDYNTPLPQLGDVKMAFRFIAALQEGNSYFTNVRLTSTPIHPAMEFDYKSTILRIYYDFDDLPHHDEQEYGLLDPLNGNMYTSPGRPRTSVGMPAGNDTEYQANGWRAELDQKYSDSWESRMEILGYHQNRWGPDVRPGGNYNWTNDTVPYTSFLDNEPANYWTLVDDNFGKYNIGPITMQSTFGYDIVDETSYNRATTLFNPGAPYNLNPGPSAGNYYPQTVVFNSQASVNSLVIPPYTAYYPTPFYSRTKVMIENAYWQQQVDVIPKWLTLTAGWTWENLEQVNVTNASVAVSTTPGGTSLAPLYPGTYTAQDETSSHFIHRFGAILHLTKNFMIYAMNSDTFSPNSGVDYYNNRLPTVQGNGSEVGAKTDLFDGKISSTISFYHEALTNQSTQAPGVNITGLGYNIAIGSTTEQGFDGVLMLSLTPGWQVIGTFYKGNVVEQNGVYQIGDTYDNSWSAFTRYDFKQGPLKDSPFWRGLAVGGGISRIGSYWQSATGDISIPGYPLGTAPFLAIKQHEGDMIDCFFDYRISRHWAVTVNIVNVLNTNFAESGQGSGDIDPVPPTTFAFDVSYHF